MLHLQFPNSLGKNKVFDGAVKFGHKRQNTKLQASQTQAIEEFKGCYLSKPLSIPKGVIHFLGAAFISAAPQLGYQALINQLNSAGYTVICTPYELTFNHVICAQGIEEKFEESLSDIRRSSYRYLASEDLPIFGMGHSNGALMHLLLSSQNSQKPSIYKSNIIMSYNNKQVKDAIPIPGLMENLGPVVKQIRQTGIANFFPGVESLLDQIQSQLNQFGTVVDPKLITQFKPLLKQIEGVIGEVEGGTSEFVPNPQESRRIISAYYKVEKTLLIKFADDSSFDETPEMLNILSGSNPIGTASLVLPGNHFTPCGGDISWEVGREFTPQDAFVQGIKNYSMTDIRRLSQCCVEWCQKTA